MRRPHSIRLASAAGLVLAAFVLGGCAPGGGGGAAGDDDAGEPVAGGTAVIGRLATEALDPGQVGYGSQSNPWTYQIFASLFEPATEPGGELQPGLATGYEYGDDGLTLTLTLRDGLEFSDGTPLDAEAVKWNFDRHITNKTRDAQWFASVTDVEATDDTTVTVTFDKPQIILMEGLANEAAGFMASPTAFDDAGADAFNISPVGAGPFMVSSVDPGQELVLEKNPTFWDADNVYLDGVTFLNAGADPQTDLVGLQSGSLQGVTWAGTYTSPAVLDAASNDPTLTVETGPANRLLILPINTFAPPFDDLRARQAINYCMDRESLAENISQGYANPAFVLSGETFALDGWEEGRDLNPLQHDVEKGTALVEELGGLSFEIVNSLPTDILPGLQQQWAECGIDAQIIRTDDWLTRVQAGDYQAALAGLSGNLNPSATSTSYIDPNAANNRFGFRDDSIWNRVVEAKGVADQDQATELWQGIWGDIAEQGYVNPLVYSSEYIVISSTLQDVSPRRNYGDYTHAWLNG